VWERSEALAQGLREGDVIEKVNGRAITSMADYYRFGPATGLPVKLGVRDKRGFQKTISITW
jgi:S1-C subfamily serine protease